MNDKEIYDSLKKLIVACEDRLIDLNEKIDLFSELSRIREFDEIETHVYRETMADVEIFETMKDFLKKTMGAYRHYFDERF